MRVKESLGLLKCGWIHSRKTLTKAFMNNLIMKISVSTVIVIIIVIRYVFSQHKHYYVNHAYHVCHFLLNFIIGITLTVILVTLSHTSFQ